MNSFGNTGGAGEFSHDPAQWKVWDASDIHDWEVEPLEWVVEPIIPKGTVGFFSGPPKAGKSFLALDLCLHLSRAYVDEDTSWLGKFRCRPTSTLYIAREDPARRIKERAVEMLDSYGWNDVAPRGLFFLIREPFIVQTADKSDDSFAEEHYEWLKSRIVKLEIGLVVLDVFNRMIPGLDENSSRDMARAIDVVERLNRETGVTVLLVDHTRKPPARDSGYRAPGPHELRGSSAKYGCADFMICVSRTEEDRQLQVYCENKDHDEHLEFLIDVSAKGSGEPKFVWAGEVESSGDRKKQGQINRQKVEEAVREGPEGGISNKEIREKTGLSKSTVGAHLRALVKKSRIQKVGTSKNIRYLPLKGRAKISLNPVTFR